MATHTLPWASTEGAAPPIHTAPWLSPAGEATSKVEGAEPSSGAETTHPLYGSQSPAFPPNPMTTRPSVMANDVRCSRKAWLDATGSITSLSSSAPV